jgi:putative protease
MANRPKGKGRGKGKAKAKATRSKTKAIRKKPVKKAPAHRASPKKRRPPAKSAAKRKAARPRAKPKAARPTRGLPAQPAPPGERIGVVTHYFGEPSVAILQLERGTLRIGDVIHFHGHTTDFRQTVESLEVDHAAVTEVGPKDDFGLKVVQRVREHDVVYKVRA